jgi:hypothetical protein
MHTRKQDNWQLSKCTQLKSECNTRERTKIEIIGSNHNLIAPIPLKEKHFWIVLWQCRHGDWGYTAKSNTEIDIKKNCIKTK